MTMFKDFRRVVLRCAFLGVEIFAVIAVLFSLLVAGAAWRLKAGPMDITFARDYLQESLKDPARGIYATMDSAALSWPDLTGPLYLTLMNGQVFNAQDQRILQVDEVALSLARGPLLIGRVAPIALVIGKPTVELVRTQDGRLNIAWNHKAEAVPPTPEETDLTTRILAYVARPGDEENTSPLATLRSLEVRQARVNVEDQILEASWSFPAVDALFNGTDDGLAAAIIIHPGEDLTPRPEAAAIEASLMLPWEGETVGFQAEVRDLSLASLARKIPQLAMLAQQQAVFNGMLEVTLDRELLPISGQLHLESAAGDLVIPDLSDAALPYEDFQFEAHYNAGAQSIQITQAGAVIKGIRVSADADIALHASNADAVVHVGIEEVKQAALGPLWPESLKGDSSEEWIVQKLSAGTFTDVHADMSVVAQEDENGVWSFSVGDINAGFAFTGMTVDYRAPLMPVTNCQGSGRFNYEQELLAVEVDACTLKDMTVNDARLEFINIITPGAGKADIHIGLSGPLQTALTYVVAEPIAMNHGFDLPQVKGSTDLEISLHFPTKQDVKMEEVTVDISGSAAEVFIPNIAQELNLSGGPFALSVKKNSFEAKGSGRLDDRAAFVAYQEFLDSKGQAWSSKTAVSMMLDPNLRKKLGMNLDDFLEGSVDIDLNYTQYQDGRGEAAVKANLKAGRLFADPFGYEKPAGTEGSAALTALIRGKNLQDITGLSVTAPGLSVENARLSFVTRGESTDLKGGVFPRLTIGETVGSLNFDYDDSGRVKIAVSGPVFDFRPFLADDEEGRQQPYTAPPMQISLAADRLRTAEGEDVTQGKIYADIDGQGAFNQLELDAVAGQGNVFLRYKPDASGKRVFRFEATDAGATLKAFDLYDNIIGGKLVVYAEPIKGVYDRNLVGLAEITNFKVVRAPVLAKLLNAMSLTGILGLLGNEGLSFTKLEAKFNWLYRQQGSLLVLQEGRTSGSSLGFTFDGTFDNAAGTIDVNGTMVPLSGINKMIGSIPLVGDILTGGTGGVFAATYSIKGKGSDPDVSVNPLSVLTPGILRRILFEQN